MSRNSESHDDRDVEMTVQSPPEPLQLTLPVQLDSVTVARRAVRELAVHSGADVHAVNVCVSEAVANAVFHAYRTGVPGEVRVVAAVVDGLLEVRVEDDGVGITPRPDSPGMGLGLPLIASWADDVEITSADPGSRVVMRFAPDSGR
jgi:anti-sigma regulatory factor (Ser/Thr protein kinase)